MVFVYFTNFQTEENYQWSQQLCCVCILGFLQGNISYLLFLCVPLHICTLPCLSSSKAEISYTTTSKLKRYCPLLTEFANAPKLYWRFQHSTVCFLESRIYGLNAYIAELLCCQIASALQHNIYKIQRNWWETFSSTGIKDSDQSRWHLQTQHVVNLMHSFAFTLFYLKKITFFHNLFFKLYRFSALTH